MKVNFELDLDLFTKDGSIEEEMQAHIVSKIIDRISDRVYKEVSEKLEVNVDKIIKEQLEKLMTKTYNEFLKKEIKVTDDYGDIIQEGTLKGIIQKRFEKFMTEKVDDRGNKATGYREGIPRVNFLIEKQLEKHSEQFMQKAISEIERKLTNTLEEELKDKIGASIAKTIGIKKITKNLIK